MPILHQSITNIEQSFNWFLSNSEVVRNVAQIIQSFITIIGIIATGIWFLQKRQIHPKARITHKITHCCIDSNMLLSNEMLLIRVIATIENIGNVLIKIDQMVILLLCAGDKDSQNRDIEKAVEYLKDYENRTNSAE